MLFATNPVIGTSDALEELRCVVQVNFLGSRLKGRVEVLLEGNILKSFACYQW